MKKKSWNRPVQIEIEIGPCKYCGKNMVNTESFVAFADKTKGHYKCMKEDDLKRSKSTNFSDSNLF
jgi:hypothetical protein